MSRNSFKPWSNRGGFRRMGDCAILSILIFLGVASCQAQAQMQTSMAPTQEQKRAQQVEEWKQALNKKGVGEKSKWEAKLLDGRKIKGYLSEIREDGFTLVDSKTEDSSRIAFSEVTALKRQGMSGYAKAAIAGGAAAGALVVAGVLAAYYANE